MVFEMLRGCVDCFYAENPEAVCSLSGLIRYGGAAPALIPLWHVFRGLLMSASGCCAFEAPIGKQTEPLRAQLVACSFSSAAAG
jgi:hypothetical protein